MESGGEPGDSPAIFRHAVGDESGPMGEGNGVISASEPRPGEDAMDAGDNDPTACCAAFSAARRLGVRTGRLDAAAISRCDSATFPSVLPD